MTTVQNNLPPANLQALPHGRAALSLFFLGAIAAASAALAAARPLTGSLTGGNAAGRLGEVAALAVFVLAARWFHAAGPRYGEKVSLRPLAALIAVVLLPPSLAIAPVLLGGAASIALEHDLDDRIALTERILLLIAAQLVVCAGIAWLAVAIPGPLRTGTGRELVHLDIATGAFFLAAYVCGLSLLTWRRAHSSSAVSPKSRKWRITWFNDIAVVLVGSPFALAAAYIFQKTSAPVATVLVAALTVALVLVSRALVEGKMVRRQLHAMDRLTQQAAIGKSPSTEHFLTDFVEHCGRLILYDRATVWLQNEQELVLEKALEYVGRAVGFQPAVRRSGEELVGRVAERGRAILVDDVRRDVRHRLSVLSERDKRALGRASAMLIPLLAAGELVGVVEFERFAGATYTRHDRERVQSLAGLVAMSLANNRQHQDVVQQAVTDGLTGLNNKRQILKSLNDEAVRAQRYGNTLSVMMLDLDGFKHFNDTYGHMQGDLLLQSLSSLIKQSIRASDIGGRYGGEEFVVVMPETGQEAAWVTAERIRSRVEAERFEATVNYEAAIGLQAPTEERTPRRVCVQKTISIGVATFPRDAVDAQDLLARADEALYTAKNSGRNRIVLAGAPSLSQPRTVVAESAQSDL